MQQLSKDGRRAQMLALQGTVLLGGLPEAPLEVSQSIMFAQRCSGKSITRYLTADSITWSFPTESNRLDEYAELRS
jgi:hypothetical protein